MAFTACIETTRGLKKYGYLCDLFVRARSTKVSRQRKLDDLFPLCSLQCSACFLRLDPKIRGTVQAPPEFEACAGCRRLPIGNTLRRKNARALKEKRKRDFRAATTLWMPPLVKYSIKLDRKGFADNTIVISLLTMGWRPGGQWSFCEEEG